MTRKYTQSFLAWYERNLTLNTAIVAVLFTWQLAHLYWLTSDVILPRLIGRSFFVDSDLARWFVIIADYAEIPALLSATVLYLREFHRKRNRRSLLFILLVNSQWLHILWITDEFVIQNFTGASIGFPLWLAWVAILIDYLEIPVIIDTLRKTFASMNTYLRARVAKSY